MAAEKRLFRVRLQETVTFEAEALVWADGADEAEALVTQGVSFDETDGVSLQTVWASEEPVMTALALTQQTARAFWLLNADGVVSLEAFQSALDPARQHELRRIELEQNNGQLPLFADVAS